MVLLDERVTEENISHTTISSGCLRSFYGCLAFCFKKKGTNEARVSLLH